MSQLNPTGATPRRSTRISNAGSKAGSVAQSGITALTNGGTKTRNKRGPLAKVTARKSNTYGSSGRVGQAEALTVHTATGFAQAFEDQRVDAVDRDDDDDEEDDEEDDNRDELGAATSKMSGGINGFQSQRSPSVESGANTPRPGQFFDRSDVGSLSEPDYSASIGDTSKSFGLQHEAGMLNYRRGDSPRESSPWAPPLWQQNNARKRQLLAQQQDLADYEDEEEAETIPQRVAQPIIGQGYASKFPATPAEKARNAIRGLSQQSPATPAEKAAIDKSVDNLFNQEQRRVLGSGPRLRPNDQPANGPPAGDTWSGNVDPHPYLQKLSWKTLVTSLLGLVLLGLLLVQGISLAMSSSFPESQPRTPSVATAVVDRFAYQWGKLAEYIQPPQKTEQEAVEEFRDSDDNIMWNRIYKLNKKFDAKIDDIQTTIKDFQNELPDFMLIRRHADGRREITDDFWHALIEKAQSQEDDTAWNKFLESNAKKLRDVFGVSIDTSGSSHWPEAVSRQEFVDTMAQHYKSLSAVVDEKVHEIIQGQASQIKAMVKEEARVAMVNNIRLQSLAQSNLITNYELMFGKVNYFSSGLGAMVEPELTSTTFLDSPQWHSRFARRLTRVPLRNPPKAALDKWEEPGDCWCAAPNPSLKGQAQLTVSLPDGIFPDQITIEHLPKDMMPSKKITNAPRTMELWVESDQPAEYQYAHRENACSPGPEGWVCLGAFTYNIHASNHQQTFDLDARSRTAVTKAMVRVTSNWGADHTCLYRVRLHGKDAVAEHEYSVRVDDPA